MLNTFYKILATVIQMRLASKIDKHIQKTQYGFRPNRSTAQALHLARRIQDLSEQSGMDLCMALLDWEKAFDKVDQKRMEEALTRLNIPKKIIKMIAALYRRPQFTIKPTQNAQRREDKGTVLDKDVR